MTEVTVGVLDEEYMKRRQLLEEIVKRLLEELSSNYIIEIQDVVTGRVINRGVLKRVERK